MKTTFYIYIIMGILFVAPLIGFNIPKIFVKAPLEKLKINKFRLVVISLFSIFIVVFLVRAYNFTLKDRYEIITEKIATRNSEVLLGELSSDEFYSNLLDMGTEEYKENQTKSKIDVTDGEEAKFQFSEELAPKYWEEEEVFPDADVIDEINPIYTIYFIEINGERSYYAIRLKKDDGLWKVDYFDKATEEQIDSGISMPSEKNGKWFTVKSK